MTAWRQLRTRWHSSITLLGFVDDRPLSEMPPDVVDRYLGAVDELSNLLLRNVVDELLIALPPSAPYDLIQRAVAIAERVGVAVVRSPGLPRAHRSRNNFRSSLSCLQTWPIILTTLRAKP